MEEEESSLSSFTYDAFLSFRGEDTRHNFVAYLRKELDRKGINTFFDDRKLRIGEDISPALSKAIEDSKICIIVFSVNYATSTWCLAELVKILDCVNKSNSKQVAVPIFYHVDPSDVRHQRNSYHDAMIKHENRYGIDSDNIQKWRSALSKAANFKGEHIISTGSRIDETTCIEKIVKDVYARIDPKPLHSGEDPVGLEDRIEKVKSLLNMKPNDDTVSMLGIYGLGGIGKTELAKALYDKIVHQFDAASFLADVREKSNRINGIEDLQKTLLSEMKEEIDIELGSSDKGIHEIKIRLRRKTVLVILDDVDDIKSLEKLAGASDWFGPGSRIVITTRDKKLLDFHKIVKIYYEMTVLNDQHSLELFCKKAFFQSYPETGYEVVASRAVRYAKGLPLALKVIGSDLATNERSIYTWESTLQEYERVSNGKIQHVLKISYDRLGDNNADCKRVFLDIACFFKGEKKDYVEEILKEYGASYYINVLVNKSLLSVEHGYLKMHDLIQDMGRQIVVQEAPNPGERSRICSYEDAIEVLTEDLGTDAIEGIMIDPPQREEVDWSGDAFKKLKRLRILIIRNTSFSREPKHLPNSLRVLDWKEYASNSFPSKFCPKKIIVINLRKSNLTTLDLPFKAFSHLTDMNFSYSESITDIPDVSGAQNLKKLTLEDCRNLITVDTSVGFLKNLSELNAMRCSALKNFPREIFLPSLEVLDLRDCIKLENFPDVTEKMKKELFIYMSRTNFKELPNSIGNLTGLKYMSIRENKELKCVPSSLFTLPNVEFLSFDECCQLGGSWKMILETPSAAHGSSTKDLRCGNTGLSDEDLLAILNFVPKLGILHAWNNKFVSLPPCIKDSVYLRELNVSECKNLKRIPKCPNSLKTLNVENCENLEDISVLPSTVEEVNARGCLNLSRETSDMLWFHSQVSSKDMDKLLMVMPGTKIPSRRFDFIGNGGNPHFWVRSGSKFPTFALALVFHIDSDYHEDDGEFVNLDLVINGRCVRTKFHDIPTSPIAPDHVLICNLRFLLDEDELLSLDAFLEHHWNQVEVVYKCWYPNGLKVSSWGIYMYRIKGTNVQFTCPDPKYPYMAPTTTVSGDEPWDTVSGDESWDTVSGDEPWDTDS